MNPCLRLTTGLRQSLPLLLLLWAALPVPAHEGHDHGPPPPPVSQTLAPRAELVSPDLEALAVLKEETLLVYLDRFADNAALAGARVELQGGGRAVKAEPAGPGVYRAEAPWLAAPGTHELVLTVQSEGLDDLLIGTLEVPKDGPGEGGLGIPMRLPDGSLFVPKESQRLLELRTAQVRREALHPGLELNGHLIPDPNASGRVQAAQTGRIEPGPEGLPHLGQTVAKGQVLAYLVPLASRLDASGQEAELAQTGSQIDLAEKRLRRLESIGEGVSRKEVEAARGELDGLRRRRAALAAGLGGREPLEAPVAGVVSLAAAVTGQVVEAREVLFEIVQPQALWVEALAYDMAQAQDAGEARVLTASGQVLHAQLLGAGYRLRNQAVPLQFRLVPPLPPLSVEEKVRVLVSSREALEGVAVPRDAVQRGSGGLPRVWVHTGAERFQPRPVRTQPLDGGRLLVSAGLEGGERVVVRGAGLLGEVR